MDFELAPEQKEIQALAREFAVAEIEPFGGHAPTLTARAQGSKAFSSTSATPWPDPTHTPSTP